MDDIQVEPLIDNKVVNTNHKCGSYGSVGILIVFAGVGVGIFMGTYYSVTYEVCTYFGILNMEGGGGVIIHKGIYSFAVDISDYY